MVRNQLVPVADAENRQSALKNCGSISGYQPRRHCRASAMIITCYVRQSVLRRRVAGLDIGKKPSSRTFRAIKWVYCPPVSSDSDLGSGRPARAFTTVLVFDSIDYLQFNRASAKSFRR